MYRKMKQDHLIMPHTRINSKWIKDLNIRVKTIKILEENVLKSWTLMIAIFFLIYFLEQGKQKKNKQMRLQIKIKSFCTAKETINKIKRQPTEWENIFASDLSDKGLFSKFIENL